MHFIEPPEVQRWTDYYRFHFGHTGGFHSLAFVLAVEGSCLLAVPQVLKILERFFLLMPFGGPGRIRVCSQPKPVARKPLFGGRIFGLSAAVGCNSSAVGVPYYPNAPALPVCAAGSAPWPCILQRPRGVALVASGAKARAYMDCFSRFVVEKTIDSPAVGLQKFSLNFRAAPKRGYTPPR